MSTSREVLAIPAFRKFFFSRMFMTFAVNMLGTIILWKVYGISKAQNLAAGMDEELASKTASFATGMTGLVEFIPFVCITLFSGYLADIYDRKTIIVGSIFTYIISLAALYWVSIHNVAVIEHYGVKVFYLMNFMVGIIRGFLSPSLSAFSAQLVPPNMYAHSSNWLSMTWHIGAVGGPAIAGILYAFKGEKITYITIILLVISSFLIFLTIPKQTKLQKKEGGNIFQSLKIGLDFVFGNQIVLGSLALDMFAVLFGGAVAMLPAFSKDVLNMGPEGLGFLRAAPAVGAIVMGIYLTKNPTTQNAGRKLLWSVAGFGLATILFAFSRNFYLSFFALTLTGLFDNVSMVIRGTIIQLYTPNEMRGRVSAVNSIFIGSSNELGAFESGVMARAMGLVRSVAFGGLMTLVVIAVTGKIAPKLRDLSIDTDE